MANYERQILVPYLCDVCSAEMLCAKLQKDIESCKNAISSESAILNRKIVTPPKPKRQATSSEDIFGRFVGLGFILLSIWLAPYFRGLWIGGVGFGALTFFFSIMDSRKAEEETEQRYKKALAEYERTVANNRSALDARPKHEQNLQLYNRRLTTLHRQLTDAQQLRSSVYSVNIIPSRYRNIHVAYYLYDYFNTCRESDLDKVIQTMLLDEIKQRLDTVIRQNEEMLLNQRYQIALQEESNRAMAEHHRESMRRIAKMEQNQELQMDYQNMIIKNQEVTNFFLAADYLRKERH